MFLGYQCRFPACQSSWENGVTTGNEPAGGVVQASSTPCSLMGESKSSSLTDLCPLACPARFQEEMGFVRAPPWLLPSLGLLHCQGDWGWPSLSGRSWALAPPGSFPRLPRPLFSHALCSPTQRHPAPAPQPIISQLHMGSWGSI